MFLKPSSLGRGWDKQMRRVLQGLGEGQEGGGRGNGGRVMDRVKHRVILTVRMVSICFREFVR